MRFCASSGRPLHGVLGALPSPRSLSLRSRRPAARPPRLWPIWRIRLLVSRFSCPTRQGLSAPGVVFLALTGLATAAREWPALDGGAGGTSAGQLPIERPALDQEVRERHLHCVRRGSGRHTPNGRRWTLGRMGRPLRIGASGGPQSEQPALAGGTDGTSACQRRAPHNRLVRDEARSGLT